MDQLLFSSSLFKIGRFSISPKADNFYQKDFIEQPTIVFPKNSIWIEYENKPAFVADTSIVNFYNHNQVYSRKAIHPEGDYCHWIKLSKQLLREVLPQAEKSEYQNIFCHKNLPCEKEVFVKQLYLLKLLINDSPENELLIEETVLELIQQLLLHQVKIQQLNTKPTTYSKRLRLVENVKSSIQENLGTNLSLNELSKSHNSSAFHLSRVFKQMTGHGINQYRTEQRLRNIVLKLQKGNDDLAYLAFDYGFSSHSHLTASFKNYFNKTPSQLLSSATI
jgi:AraC-like DNA-binding protein